MSNASQTASNFLAFLLLGCVWSITADNATATTTTTTLGIETVEVKVLGQSGKFTILSESAGETDSSKETVLYELDSAGNNVGATGPVHSIQLFAPQDFVVSGPERGQVGNVTTDKITLKTIVGTFGELSVNVIIVLGHGFMGPESEREVFPGDIKWNIKFTSWSFCEFSVDGVQGGNKETGEFLKLSVEVKGKDGAASQDANTTKKYTLGGGVDLLLTDRVTLDGVEDTMPAGFSEVVVTASNKQKFTPGAVYDPVFTFSSADSVDEPTSSEAGGFHGAMPILMLLLGFKLTLGEIQ